MKLYVWNDPYHVSYGGSIVYAVAETEDEARALASRAPVSQYGGDPSDSVEGLELGAPDRVLEVPCAEIYQWQE